MGKLVVAGLTGTIYDAVLSKNPEIMTGKRKDRTSECITAVAAHMKHKADYNEEQKGFWQYRWEGIGKLTWEAEKKEDVNDGRDSEIQG